MNIRKIIINLSELVKIFLVNSTKEFAYTVDQIFGVFNRTLFFYATNNASFE